MRVRHNFKFLLILIGVLTGFSCSEEDLRDFSVIKYGTSFGMCEGYCITTITIQDESMLYEQSSFTDETTYPPTECPSNFPLFADFRSKIDPDIFYDMPETIGCPDCADGGAEWVELQSLKTSHRVTFELGKAPDEFISYIENLRFYVQRMEAICP